MKHKFIYKKSLPHILAWLAIFFINIFIIDSIPHDSDADFFPYLYHNIFIWTIYIILFYFNYKILIPKLLFKSKYFKFVLCVIITISITSVCVTGFKQYNRRKKFKTDILTESVRTDITVFKKNKNIHRIEQRLDNTYGWRNYNPIYYFNILSTYGLLMIVISSIAIAVLERWLSREKIVEEIKRQKIESELAYLKQQINPHFLFNALNSIYSLVLPHSDQASDVVLKLSSILRYMLYETDRDKVQLDKEVEIISDYIELQKLKYSDCSGIKYEFDGDFSAYSVEPLLMLPFIENAFKYGTNNIDTTDIKIEVSCIGGKLIFEVVNKILVKKTIDSHSGIGVKNISRRLDILYKDNYVLKIGTIDNFFYVKMELPLISK